MKILKYIRMASTCECGGLVTYSMELKANVGKEEDKYYMLFTTQGKHGEYCSKNNHMLRQWLKRFAENAIRLMIFNYSYLCMFVDQN